MDFLGLGSAFKHTFLGKYTEEEKRYALNLQKQVNDAYSVEQAREKAWAKLTGKKNQTGQDVENNIIGIALLVIGGVMALGFLQK